MKIKKLIFTIPVNAFIAITYPAILSISSSGSSLKGVAKSTIMFLILFNIFLLLYHFISKKKPKVKVLLTGTKIVAVALSVIYIVAVLFVPLSSPFSVLSLSLKLRNPETEVRSVCSEDLGDNRYLEVIESDGIYECFIVRKKMFAFCHDIRGHNYNWDNSDINSHTPGLTDDVPKFLKHDKDSIIIYSALSDDVDKAYIDGKEMSVVTDGTIRLAYYIIEGASIDPTNRYVLTKENKNGEVIFLTKM